MDLWKQAYRTEFGHDPEEDMPRYASDIEAWRVSWQSGYDAGEDWALSMLERPEEDQEDADDLAEDSDEGAVAQG